MKFLRALFCLLLLIPLSSAVAYFPHGFQKIARSELVLSPIGTDYSFLNLMKGATQWNYGNNSGVLKDDELDTYGNPIYGGAWSSASGAKALIQVPSQAERPGHYVFTWTGVGKFGVGVNGTNNTAVSCTGSSAAGGGLPTCDNTGCSTFTASINSTTLTVTSAPTGSGCTLGAGVPISGSGVTVSKFGTETIITSSGSTCGPNTCYTVNQSQTISSETMQIGGRFEIAVGTSSPGNDVTSTTAQWIVQQTVTSSTAQAANYALYHLSDESAFEASATPCGRGQACIIGGKLKTRIQEANFASLRDLNWALGNVSSCTTWSSRTTLNYYSYATSELRNAASGPGQYVNAGGTGASAGTVSYNAGSDVYSITLGSGNWVDKQTVIILMPSTGTSSSKISLNGNTAVPILAAYGAPLSTAFGSFVPQSGRISSYVYDAVLGGLLAFGGANKGDVGLQCGVPPEVFIEINAELQTTPWHIPGALSLDPMTDWTTQYASYLKTNYSPPYGKPIFETTNEPFNCGSTYNAPYLSYKSAVYIGEDTAWSASGAYYCGPTGNNYEEIGKMASTIGQDLTTALGAGNFELLIPVQTGYVGTSIANGALRSDAYVNQTIAPTQGGYTQTPAYEYATRVSVNNYWNTGYYQTSAEVALAYCYYNYSISSPCQGLYAAQAAIMTTKFASSITNVSGVNNIYAYNTTYWPQWQTYGAYCSYGAGSRPGNCTLNQTSPLMLYEGGYAEGAQQSDVTQIFTTATNANPAVLAIAGNGCVAGQTVALSALSGGTWSIAAGSYTVQASGTDSSHCAINLDSTSLGTLSGATLTYTGSANYVSYTRLMSYTAPGAATYQTVDYNDALANGGINPSQFQLGGSYNYTSNNTGWQVWGFDIYGYWTEAKCTGCTISGTTLTLGGTITGTFANGQTLFGAGVSGLGTGAGTNSVLSACSTSGSGPCGTNSSDTFTLSQSSTVGSGTAMTGNATPSQNTNSTDITSPVTAWKAICNWNSNGGSC